MPRNKVIKARTQSARKRCKPGAWNNQAAADRAILRLEAEHPLNTLGMRSYWCRSCSHYHIGRAGESQ
jgi:hypothetical protein